MQALCVESCCSAASSSSSVLLFVSLTSNPSPLSPSITAVLLFVFCRASASSAQRAVSIRLFCNMPVVTLMVHPKGLHPLQAAKAWIKHREEGLSLHHIMLEGEVVNMEGNVPTLKTLWAAIQRVDVAGQDQFAPKSNCHNCGRSRVLSEGDVKKVVVAAGSRGSHLSLPCASCSLS